MIRTRLLEWRPTKTFWAAIVLSTALAGLQATRHIAASASPTARWFFNSETRLLDAFYRARRAVSAPGAPDDALVLILLDHRATREIPAYGSRKDYLAALLNRIAEGHPTAVAIDLVLTSETGERSVELRKLGLTEEQVATLDTDRNLLEAMKRLPVILPYRCLERHIPGEFQVAGRVSKDTFLQRVASVRATEVDKIYNIVGVEPLGERYLNVAAETAHSCEWLDADGKLRTDATVLAHSFSDHRLYFLSMPAAVARRALGVPWKDVRVDGDGLWLGDRLVPTDEHGMSLIGYSGPTGTFAGRDRSVSPQVQLRAARQRLSAARVLADNFDPSMFEGKVVLLGLSVAADRKRTPFSTIRAQRMPGIEKIAMHADAILRGERLVYRPAWDEHHGYLLTALFGFLGAVVGTWMSLRRVAVLAPLGMLLPIGVSFALFLGGVWIDASMLVVGWTVALAVSAGARFVMEERQRSLLETIVGRYLSPQIFQRLRRDPKLLELRGEEREVTILFADLRDFTTWSEEQSAAQVVRVLNEHMDALTQVVFDHGGTVDKFVGDCLVAYWGAPLPDPQHASHACEAAIEMLAVLDRQNQARVERGEATLDMGVGINTGIVVVGNMGSSQLFNYTVVGDAVNVASRLEGLTKMSSFRILVGPRTRDLARQNIELVSIGPVRVKGKRASVEAFGIEAARKPGRDEVDDQASA